MLNLGNAKNYSLVTGGLLFLLGVVGFAFRDNFNMADKYLLLSMVLGFWGILAGLYDSK